MKTGSSFVAFGDSHASCLQFCKIAHEIKFQATLLCGFLRFDGNVLQEIGIYSLINSVTPVSLIESFPQL